jgi:hypothetical protein
MVYPQVLLDDCRPGELQPGQDSRAGGIVEEGDDDFATLPPWRVGLSL